MEASRSSPIQVLSLIFINIASSGWHLREERAKLLQWVMATALCWSIVRAAIMGIGSSSPSSKFTLVRSQSDCSSLML